MHLTTGSSQQRNDGGPNPSGGKKNEKGILELTSLYLYHPTFWLKWTLHERDEQRVEPLMITVEPRTGWRSPHSHPSQQLNLNTSRDHPLNNAYCD